MTPTIQTYSGSYFDFVNPDSTPLSIKDIAHALSNICRFGGHVRSFYSVAQHSVLVSRLLPLPFRKMGLLHDAGEAVLGDIPTPLKRMLPDYKVIETRVENSILNSLGIPLDFPPDIKAADLILLATEQRDLMPLIEEKDRPAWGSLTGILANQEKIIPLCPKDAEELFLQEYYALENATCR